MNRRKSARAGPVVLEALESRLLLSGTLQISEFMAINNATLADQNGDYSDWIEIHNLTGAPVDLNGWALTDSAGDLMKWRFPAVSIPGMGYLVVFASNKDRAVAGQQLHTNFQLSGGGEYLALVRPDGTVEHEYAPTYPQQAGDVSYGMTTASTMETIMPAGVEAKYAIPTGALSGWSNEVYADGSWTDDTSSLGYDNQPIGAGDTVTLVEAGAPVRVLVPSSDIGTAWHGLGFTPTGWLTGTTGVGFDSAPDYDPMIGLDIQAQMYNIRASAYLRIEFQVGNPATVTSLTLQMKRDDGFVAWINGTKVQSVGAPTTLLWNSGATGSVSPEPTPAGSYISYDITSYLSSLVAGTNVLAIQGLNVTAGNGDFLILPRLEANVNSTPTYAYDGYFDTDMEAAMAGVNSTAYVRIPFQVQGSALPSSLALKMKYDDGFVAYINGTKVASRNAPTTPAWNSTATAEHLDSAAVVYEVIDISAYISSLHLGANMLAIQGLNLTASDSDFLLVPEMDAVWTQTVEDLTRYFTVPTPGAANGTGAADLGPIITNAAFGPQIPTDAQDITVTARIRQAFSPITDVNMKYCVNFGGEVNVTMSDDGLHGDGAAGDGVYGATIPASASTPGQMVRFRLTAQDATTTSQWPLFDDSTGERQSAKYLGTVVQDTSYAATQLPVFMYFVQSATAADSRTGTRGAVYYNGELYDNVFIRERGGTINGGIAEGAGQSRKIKFNDDHRFLIDPSRPRVGDININAAGPQDESYLRQVLSFWLYDQSGGVAETTFLMHCRQNGLYMGVRVFHDQMDADKLALEGLDKDGPLYYMYNKLTTSSYSNVRIDNPKPNTTYPNDLHDLAYGVDPANANRHTYVMDNLDLPALVNYLAVEALIQDGDCTTHNWSTYRDPDTGEWQIIGHDRDLTFGSWVDAGADWSRVTTFGDSSNNYSGDRYWMHPFYAASEFPHADYNGRGWVVLIDAIHDDPIAHEMFYRRLRTLMDQFYGAPGEPAQWTINAKIDELVASLSYEVDNGLLPPQGGGSAANFLIEINNLKNNYVNKRRNYLYGVLGPYMRYNLPTNLNWVTAGAGDQYAPAAQPAAFAGQITIGTVEYAPASGNQDEEYIQLVNPNAYAVDISGWRFASAVDYTFPSGTVIVAGGSLYVSPNSAAFRARTTGPRGGQGLFVQDAYQGKLASDGEVVRLLDPNGNLIASKAFGGETVVINELLANSHGGAKDWIELYNPSNSPVDVGNWYLSNSQTNLIKYRIPVGTVIGANSYVVFNQLDQFGAAFDLNHEGDDVYLTNATGTYIVDSRDFNASDDLVTLGRYLTSEGRYEFTALSAATLGAANAAPLVGPVVISEIMYHPLSGNDEYVELHNITDLPVSLYDPAQPSQTWTLSGGVDYTFPTGLEILAHGYAVVTGADVSTPAAEAAFRARYGIAAGVLVKGPWDGALNNAGEDVNLNKPGETDPLAGTYGHVRVDRVEYQPDYPWPVAADGTGKFLERINDDQFGNDPVNWQASDGAPWVFIDDVSLTEGNSGTVNAIFTVSLNKASGLLVTVQYATADGTAVQPGDYTSASGMLTFNPGVTSQTVTVPVKGDTLDEDNETFYVNLSSPSNATISDSQGVGTINDNDSAPSLSINDVAVTEGDSGTVDAVFTVSLSAASGRTVTVQYATADGTAVQPGDYTSASGTLTFNPGVTSQTVTVPVVGDMLDEADSETFVVNLSTPVNATVADSQGTGTINDNDSTPSVLSRCIFYNASIWDWSVDADANHNGQFDLGEDGSNDDAAIATDKVALLPGETSGATNRTGYAKGINGIMVDIAGLPNPAGLSAADFAFKVGTGSDPSAWDPAPAPQGVTVRQGAGLNGSDRVTIIWANEQITGTWLQVTVLANPNTGLASQDVFYFGNLPADFNSDGVVDYLDLGALATKYRNTVGSLSQGDANGDGVADYLDLGILASNYRKSVAGNEQAEPEALLALSSPSHDSAGDLSSAEASPARADAEPAVQVVDLLGLTRQPQPMAAGAAAKSSAFGAATRRRQSTGAGWPGIISPLDMDILATPPG